MRPRLSLPVRVVLVILLVSSMVGLAHYFASRTLMTEALHDIQTLHARNAHALVTGDIAQGIEHVREVAGLLKQHPGLALAASRDHQAPAVRQARLKQMIDALGPLLGANIIEIFDTDETLLFSTHPPARRADKPGIWGVFEALSGDDVLVTSEDRGLVIRAIVPLATSRGIEAALAVGMRIDDQMLRKWVGTDGVALVLVDVHGAMLASSAGAQPVDQAMINASLRSKDDVNHTHSGDWTTTTYFGMPIVDQTYVWIARQDSSTVFTSFGYARSIELIISVVLAAVSALILGWLAYRHARAIFNLQREAESVIAREFGEAAPRLGGSEIRQLTASVQLMEQRLVSRAHELSRSYHALQAASSARNEFFASISHDLRTPINAILGYAHYARQHAGNAANAGLHSDLDKLDAAANALLFLVNDVLDFAKIESGQFEIQPVACDIDGMLQSVADLIAPNAQQKKLAFMLDIEPGVPREIVIDPIRLRQILVNLCSNAVKFTARGEIVLRVGIARDASQQKKVVFSVSDTGIGISTEEQARLFVPFVRGTGTHHRDQPGTGLGLALCKKLTELMDGSIELHSMPDAGTSVVVTLPMVLPVQPVQPALPAPAWPGTGQRVVVIAANDTLRGVLCRMIDDLGYTALGTADVATARTSLTDADGQHGEIVAVIFDESASDTAAADITPLLDAAARRWIVLSDRHDASRVMPGAQRLLHKPVTRTSLLAALQDRAPEAARASADGGLTLAGTRVLLAEDNLSNQEIAARALRDAGADVVIADDGSKAAAAATSQPFDVVVMDIQMPVMNGLEATRTIRGHPELLELPIIGVSASAVIGDRANCLSAGMTEYVTKPIAPDALVAVVASHLKRRTGAAAPAAGTAPAAVLSGRLAAIAAAGFDVQRGLIMTGGESQYLRTLERFIADTQRVAGQARTLLARGDVTAATREVHGITGDAGLLGADAIRQAALAAEQAIFAGAPARERLLAELEALLGTTRDNLHAGGLANLP